MRWESEREVRRERWWVNWDEAEGAELCKDCWPRMMAFDLKLVSVWFSGLGRALPTLNFGFCCVSKVIRDFHFFSCIYVVKNRGSNT